MRRIKVKDLEGSKELTDEEASSITGGYRFDVRDVVISTYNTGGSESVEQENNFDDVILKTKKGS